MNFFFCLCVCLCVCWLYVEFVAAARCYGNNVNIPSRSSALNMDDFEKYVVGQAMAERFRAEPIGLPNTGLPDTSLLNSNILHTKISKELFTQEFTYNIPNPTEPGIFCIRKQAHLIQDRHCDKAMFSAIFDVGVRTKTVYWSSDPSRYVLMLTCGGLESEKMRTCPLARTVVSVLLPETSADAVLDDVMMAAIAKDLKSATGIKFESENFKWSEVPYGETQTAVRYYSPDIGATVNYAEYDLHADGVRVDDTTSLVFQTRGDHDAFFLLQENCNNFNHEVIEVVLGGFSNTKSFLRSAHQQNPAKDEYVGAILNPAEFQWFWISWENGLVEVGKGQTVGADTVMSWDGLTHDINCARITYGFGSSGEWIFYKPGDCTENNPGDINM